MLSWRYALQVQNYAFSRDGANTVTKQVQLYLAEHRGHGVQTTDAASAFQCAPRDEMEREQPGTARPLKPLASCSGCSGVFSTEQSSARIYRISLHTRHHSLIIL